MVSHREELREALRIWLAAEGELQAAMADRALGDHDDGRVAEVARLRGEYQRLYTVNMRESLDRLREADQRRAASLPSTPAFDEATRDTEIAEADIWEQARGVPDTPSWRADDR
jgi:hypothetical protein